MGRLKDWNDRQRAAAKVRMRGNEATMAGLLGQVPLEPGQEDPREWVKANRGSRVAELAGVHVFGDRIVRLNTWPLPGGEMHSIAGVTASVDNVGGVSARSTLARTAVPGAHGWQKKVDTRECWLVVDGPDFQWTVQVPQLLSSQARAFAAAVTTAGRRAATAG